jgi:hypothetical protein
MITSSLTHMTSARPGENWGKIQMATEGVSCKDKPVSVLVSAVYKTVGW